MKFESNMKYIESHNQEADAGKHTFRLAMNRFGDMSNEEIRREMNGYSNLKSAIPDYLRTNHVSENTAIPDSVGEYFSFRFQRIQFGSNRLFAPRLETKGRRYAN